MSRYRFKESIHFGDTVSIGEGTIYFAFNAWHNAPFPIATHDELLSELFSELAYLDSYVADGVLGFKESGVFTPGKMDVVLKLKDFLRQLSELEIAEDVGRIEAVDSMAHYAQSLISVYEETLIKAS